MPASSGQGVATLVKQLNETQAVYAVFPPVVARYGHDQTTRYKTIIVSYGAHGELQAFPYTTRGINTGIELDAIKPAKGRTVYAEDLLSYMGYVATSDQTRLIPYSLKHRQPPTPTRPAPPSRKWWQFGRKK